MEDESPKVNVVSELRESRIELVEQTPEDASDSGDKTQTTASTSRLLGSRFHLIDEIGSGAWSKVYSAKDTRLNNKLVAVKVMHAHLLDGTEKLRRFQLEAETFGALKHQGIVRVYEYGCDGGEHPYLVTDLISGQSLAYRLANEGTLTVTESALLALQLADALSYAHSQGIIHRDLKPANIIIDGATKEAKLVDFGIVKTIATENTPELTQTGDIVGTPQYMSPEHCEGRALTGHSDVYSLGCIMWESIQGQKPFDGKSTFDCMRKHLELEPAPLFPDSKDKAQRAFAEIVKACLSKSPKNRLTANALKRTLELFMQGDYDSCREILSQYKKQDLSNEPAFAGKPGVSTTTSARKKNFSISLLNCSLFLAIAGLSCYLLFLAVLIWYVDFERALYPEDFTIQYRTRAKAAAPPTVSAKDFLPHTPKAKYAQIAGGHAATFSRMLENAMIDVASGIDQLRKDGKSADAAKLTEELNEFKFRFAQSNKKFFDKEKVENNTQSVSTSTPIHAVVAGQAPPLNMYTKQGGTTVVVTTKRPVRLFLHSDSSMAWRIEAGPDIRIEDITTSSPKGLKTSITGVPAALKVTSVVYANTIGDTPPYSSELTDFESLVQKRYHQKPLTTQGISDVTLPVAVGPESQEWRSQILLRQLAPLHAKAMIPVRKKLFEWIDTVKPGIAWKVNSEIRYGVLKAPNETFDFMPGVVASDFSPGAHCRATFSETNKWHAQGTTCSKVAKSGSNFYTVTAEGVMQLGTNRVLRPPTDSTFRGDNGDIATNSNNDHLLVRSSNQVFDVDPATGKWTGLCEFTKEKHTLPAEENGITSHANKLYSLREGGWHDTSLLVGRDLSGKVLDTKRLSYNIPLLKDLPAYSHEQFIIVLANVPYEAGRTRFPPAIPGVIEGTTENLSLVDSLNHLSYLYVVERASGRVLLICPLNVGDSAQ